MANRVTTVVGEDKAPITTLALGEEHVITTLVGEQAQPHPDYAAATGSSEEGPEANQASATTVVGESWTPITTVVGESGAANANAVSATTVVGEQGGGISTLALGEETIFTTTVVGEEGGGGPATTLLGESGGGQQTTTLLGEQGGGRPPITTTVVGEENSATTIVGEGGPFGGY